MPHLTIMIPTSDPLVLSRLRTAVRFQRDALANSGEKPDALTYLLVDLNAAEVTGGDEQTLQNYRTLERLSR